MFSRGLSQTIISLGGYGIFEALSIDVDDINSTDSISTALQDEMHQTIMQQRELFDLMTKISLLTIICEILCLVWVAFGIMTALNNQYSIYSHDIIQIGFYWGQVLSVCFNCFALYSTFTFNHNDYLRCCGI